MFDEKKQKKMSERIVSSKPLLAKCRMTYPFCLFAQGMQYFIEASFVSRNSREVANFKLNSKYRQISSAYPTLDGHFSPARKFLFARLNFSYIRSFLPLCEADSLKGTTLLTRTTPQQGQTGTLHFRSALVELVARESNFFHLFPEQQAAVRTFANDRSPGAIYNKNMEYNVFF